MLVCVYNIKSGKDKEIVIAWRGLSEPLTQSVSFSPTHSLQRRYTHCVGPQPLSQLVALPSSTMHYKLLFDEPIELHITFTLQSVELNNYKKKIHLKMMKKGLKDCKSYSLILHEPRVNWIIAFVNYDWTSEVQRKGWREQNI